MEVTKYRMPGGRVLTRMPFIAFDETTLDVIPEPTVHDAVLCAEPEAKMETDDELRTYAEQQVSSLEKFGLGVLIGIGLVFFAIGMLA